MGQIHFVLGYLKEFNIASLLLRMFLSVVVGGIIGFERGVTGARQVSGHTSWCAWAPP